MNGSDDEDPEGFAEDRPRGFGEKKMPEHYHGHRSRLWERFRKSDGEALEDYEVLELLLSVAIRRINTKPLAKALLVKFGSFADVLSAPRGRLKEVPGVGDRVADLLKLSQIAASRFLRGKVDERKILASWRQVVDYTRVAMGFSEIEEFRILFLDKQNRLIADEIQQRGTIDHTPVYPREVVKRALELSASGIVLIHNHPSGDTTPSQADINMTRRIKEMAELFGIVLHDHLIIGRQNHTSLRALKLF